MDSPILHLIVLVIGIVTAAFKTFKFVHEGELGIRLRFGRATRNSDGTPKIIQPGFVFLIPWVEILKRHHVRQQTIRFNDQKIMTKDGLIFNISAVVIFRVIDIYKALFEIDQLDASIADVGTGVLRDVMSAKEHHELGETAKISGELLKGLEQKASEWGVSFLQFNLVDCAPTPETAHLVVAQKGATMKAEAIQDAAKKLGIPLSEIPTNLAAVLVGMPMVAVAGASVGHTVVDSNNDPDGEQEEKEPKHSYKFSLFGGD